MLKPFFFKSGKNPKLLITSGIHGDEFEVVSSLEKAIKKFKSKMPDYIYIPVASPSAYKLKTRENKNGADLNREFYKGTIDNEALNIMEFLKNYTFDLHLDFHEDATLHDFYLYDVPQSIPLDRLKPLFDDLKKIGIEPWEGVDNPDDPTLGNLVINGYATVLENSEGIDVWLRKTNRCPRSMVFEVPGLASQQIKDKIVDTVWTHLLMDYTELPSLLKTETKK